MILLDSSIWLAYVYGPNEKVKQLVDSDEEILISVLSLFEIKRKLLLNGLPIQKIDKALSLMRGRSLVIDVNRVVSESAAQISFHHKLSTADAIIYATTLEKKSLLVTADNDFVHLPNVRIIKLD